MRNSGGASFLDDIEDEIEDEEYLEDDDEFDEDSDADDADDGPLSQLAKVLEEFGDADDASAEELVKSNPVVRGLNKSINKKHGELVATRQQVEMHQRALEVAANENAQLSDTVEELSRGYNMLAGLLHDALPAEDQKEFMARINSERTALAGERFNRERNRLASSQNRQAASQQVETGESEYDALVRKAEEDFLRGRQVRAQKMGINPRNPKLDYGQPGQNFIERLAAFEDSLDQLSNEDDDDFLDDDDLDLIESVRPKRRVIQTRSGGGTTPTRNSGKDSLDVGAEQIWRSIQNNSKQRPVIRRRR